MALVWKDMTKGREGGREGETETEAAALANELS